MQQNHIEGRTLTTAEKILLCRMPAAQAIWFKPEIVKLMLFLKAHALSLGHSGVQVETVPAYYRFYNNDVIPVVYDRGSLGASAILAPLSNLFLSCR
jgi:histidine ammonia-lyase